jgi:hypothetical protein
MGGHPSLLTGEKINHVTHFEAQDPLPMFWTDRDFVDINTILEPSFRLRYLHIIPAHLPLPHPAIVLKSPIFKTVTSMPLSSLIMPLVPELDCNLLMNS